MGGRTRRRTLVLAALLLRSIAMTILRLLLRSIAVTTLRLLLRAIAVTVLRLLLWLWLRCRVVPVLIRVLRLG